MPSFELLEQFVRPRVWCNPSGEPRLLEDVIAERIAEGLPGVVWLVGEPGLGKSTALAYIARLFEQVLPLDEPSGSIAQRCGRSQLVLATTRIPARKGEKSLRIMPWTRDDLVEYLLSVCPDQCASVMSRLGPAACSNWSPELGRIVLDRFGNDTNLNYATDALVEEVRHRACNSHDMSRAMRRSFAILCADGRRPAQSWLNPFESEPMPALESLLRHRAVQIPLATELIVRRQLLLPFSDN